MAESSRRVAPGNDNSLEALWVEHNHLAQQTDDLATEVHRSYGELRQELRAIHARLDRLQPVRAAGNAVRRGAEVGRQRPRGSQTCDTSDSEDELEHLRNLNMCSWPAITVARACSRRG
ncbi:hypothetical protein M5K25_024875 [Dendrobium thyrsiflorum]|uniref:Uncharacterized protein n=1 Tax=Dendrobium thyrsiflorum TaxID=117978 RepID=A0ABD0U394_DENTH